MEAKRAALKNLIKQMQSLMVKGHGDESIEDELAEHASGAEEFGDMSVKSDGKLPDELAHKEPTMADEGAHGVDSEEGEEDELGLKDAVKKAFAKRNPGPPKKAMIVARVTKVSAPSPSAQMMKIAKKAQKRGKM